MMTERDLLIALTKMGVGYDAIGLIPMQNGTFGVYSNTSYTAPLMNGEEYIFQTPEEAVDFLLQIRHERKIGFDYEKI